VKKQEEKVLQCYINHVSQTMPPSRIDDFYYSSVYFLFCIFFFLLLGFLEKDMCPVFNLKAGKMIVVNN
jgi:hypothetical protein